MRKIADKQQRDFKGIWIPAEIWLNDSLSFLEVILLAEIDSLAKDEGCYASNAYFAEFLGVSETYVSKAISSLTKKGLVYQAAFNGRNRILKTNLHSSKADLNKSITLEQKYKADLNKSARQTITKVQPYNIEDNIDDSNTPYTSLDVYPLKGESQPKKNVFKAPTIEEVEAYGKSKGFTKTDYVDFWEFYENKGWKVGNVKMKNWQLALNRWERNQKGKIGYGIDKRHNQKDTSNNSGSCNSSSVYSEFELRDDD